MLAILTIRKYEPAIVGVTGTAGKTSAKEAIYAVLKNERFIRVAGGSFNNELGLPLTILGDWKKIEGIFFWPKVILTSVWNLIKKHKYPEILILEYGVQKPGDMAYLLSIAKPSIGVMTAFYDVPAHMEFFASAEGLLREKMKLLQAVPAIGFTIFNADDVAIAEASESLRSHVMTFGYGAASHVRVANFENLFTEERPVGITFKLNYGGNFVPVRFEGVLGKAQSYAAAAGACVGFVFGSNLVKIAEGLSRGYHPAEHRMAIVAGVSSSFLIDDSYNAAPLSMHAALETLRDFPADRRGAILGEMRELGKYSLTAHEEAGRLAGKTLDFLITVGAGGKFIAEGAMSHGMDKKNIKSFDSVVEATTYARNFLRKGDLVLIKASRAVELDRVVDGLKL